MQHAYGFMQTKKANWYCQYLPQGTTVYCVTTSFISTISRILNTGSYHSMRDELYDFVSSSRQWSRWQLVTYIDMTKIRIIIFNLYTLVPSVLMVISCCLTIINRFAVRSANLDVCATNLQRLTIQTRKWLISHFVGHTSNNKKYFSDGLVSRFSMSKSICRYYEVAESCLQCKIYCWDNSGEDDLSTGVSMMQQDYHTTFQCRSYQLWHRFMKGSL